LGLMSIVLSHEWGIDPLKLATIEEHTTCSDHRMVATKRE
jgi:hypothetical protein